MTDYTKVNADWQDSPSTSTPITAAGLEQMEEGIDNAHEEIDALDTRVTALEGAGGGSTVGTLASRPTAASAGSGGMYFATDQVVQYVSDGSNWHRTSLPAGTVVSWFKSDSAVPSGWVLYDGSNLPASTGIYADLYAHLGSTLTTPDTRARVLVGKGTHADVDTMGENDGVAVGNRSPKHNSTESLTVDSHTHGATALTVTGSPTVQAYEINDGGSGSGRSYFGAVSEGSTPDLQSLPTVTAGTLDVGGNTDGATATISGTIGPGGTLPVDTPAYIVCLKIAKL